MQLLTNILATRGWLIVVGVGYAMLTGQEAAAATQAGDYAVRGPGAKSCTAYLAAIKNNESTALQEFHSWMGGYISGFNRTTEGVFDVWPYGGVGSFGDVVASVCDANREHTLDVIVGEVITNLEDLYLARSSGIAAIENSGVRMQVRKGHIRRIQGQLKRRGRYGGETDGLYGPRTKEALEGFQKEHGLEVNGLPDFKTSMLLLEGK